MVFYEYRRETQAQEGCAFAEDGHDIAERRDACLHNRESRQNAFARRVRGR